MSLKDIEMRLDEWTSSSFRNQKSYEVIKSIEFEGQKIYKLTITGAFKFVIKNHRIKVYKIYSTHALGKENLNQKGDLDNLDRIIEVLEMEYLNKRNDILDQEIKQLENL